MMKIVGMVMAAALAAGCVTKDAYDIRPDAKGVHMKAEWLERILKTAREKGMAVIGFDEI